MCLNNEEWSITRLAFNIRNSIAANRAALPLKPHVADGDRVVKWNCGN
jgi:hypothetical protein